MDVATAVGLVIAVISLIVAIIIGRCQIKQNNRMAAFEKRPARRLLPQRPLRRGRFGRDGL